MDKDLYVKRSTRSGRNPTAKGTIRDWWLIKPYGLKGRVSVEYIMFPLKCLGKRIRIKIEFINKNGKVITMPERRECICGHGKTGHRPISIRRYGKVIKYPSGKNKINHIGKCQFPNCKCKKYKRSFKK